MLRGFRSVLLFVLAWPLTGLGLVIAEAGTQASLALLVPAGSLIAAAGLTVLRDRDDVANHFEWGWSTIGHGRTAGVVIGVALAGLGLGLFGYGAIGTSLALGSD